MEPKDALEAVRVYGAPLVLLCLVCWALVFKYFPYQERRDAKRDESFKELLERSERREDRFMDMWREQNAQHQRAIREEREAFVSGLTLARTDIGSKVDTVIGKIDSVKEDTTEVKVTIRNIGDKK